MLKFFNALFLRAPFYSFLSYDLDRLPLILQDPAFQNGLYLASPAFYRELKEKGFEAQHLTEKELHSVAKYYNRMSFRPTPFGSFASFSLLEWGRGGTVRLAGQGATSLCLLPDAKMPFRSTSESLIKNPTLYRAGNEFRYARSVIDASGHYRFSLDAVPADAFYLALFELFGQPFARVRLPGWIAETSGCSAAEASDFLDFLLAEQILYGQERAHIIGREARDGACSNEGGAWSHFRPVRFPVTTRLTGIAAEAAAFYEPQPENKATQYFYAGLGRPVIEGGPGPDDRAALGRAMELLGRIAQPPVSATLEKFKREFAARFDRREVPLLTALDPDEGVAYGNFGIRGLAREFEDLRVQDPGQPAEPAEWTSLHRRLLSLWIAAQQNGKFAPLVLPDDLLHGFEPAAEAGALPPSIAVMFRKTAGHLLIEYTGGASAVALVGRFSVFDDKIASLCRELAGREAQTNPDVIFADIGQLSNEHTDNINRRLQVYDYEIPLNVFSDLDPARQLRPDDLTLCMRDGQLLLRSKSLGKRVIPRLASAYNYNHNELAIFRLLCDLQYQGLRANLNLKLEHFFPGLDFYPRVLFGRTVLCPARWNLPAREISALKNAAPEQALTVLQELRERFALPQYVSIGQYDRQLVFDLANKQEAAFLVKCIKSEDTLVVTEYLLPDRSVKTGYDPLAGQFIAFLHHDREIYRGISMTENPAIGARIERSFQPGTGWLFLKIFCTPASADRILAEVIVPVVNENANSIQKWFFVRYTDQGYHLRVRFLVEPERAGSLLVALKKQLRDSGNESLVRNYQTDTYDREMERYAGVMEQAEDLFCAGSELCTGLLRLPNEARASVSEFFPALYTAFHLLRCFYPAAADARTFAAQMETRFLNAFSGRQQLKKDMDAKYRELREQAETWLAGPFPFLPLSAVFAGLLKRAAAIASTAADFSPERRRSLLADLLHMQINRSFPVKQRTHEYMVYFFLSKYLRTATARGSKALVPFADQDRVL